MKHLVNILVLIASASSVRLLSTKYAGKACNKIFKQLYSAPSLRILIYVIKDMAFQNETFNLQSYVTTSLASFQ